MIGGTRHRPNRSTGCGLTPAGRPRAAVRRILASVAAVVIGVAIGAASAGPASASEDTCDRFELDSPPGVVQAEDFDELSGLIASRAFPGMLWAHNDSGDVPRLLAMNEAGEAIGRWAVAGAEAVDWEDIAAGPGPDSDRSYLYIGDIGDNLAARDHLTVYRVPEPDVVPAGDGTLEGAEAIDLRYGTGPADAEALLVDPRSGDLVIITKEVSGRSAVFAAKTDQLLTGTPVAMETVGVFDVLAPEADAPTPVAPLPSTLVTAADISPDGSIILVRTYQQVLAFTRSWDESVAEALEGAPCVAPSRPEPQGEAVAWSAGGDAYFTASEVQLPRTSGWVPVVEPIPWSRVSVTPPAALAAVAAVAASTSAASHTGIDRSRGLVAGMVLVVIAVLAGSVVVGHRRKRIGS